MKTTILLIIILLFISAITGCKNTQTNPTPGPGYPDKEHIVVCNK